MWTPGSSSRWRPPEEGARSSSSGETFGIRSRIERSFRTLKRTNVFANNVNARRLHVRVKRDTLNVILSIFQYYTLAQVPHGDRSIPALSSMGGGLHSSSAPDSSDTRKPPAAPMAEASAISLGLRPMIIAIEALSMAPSTIYQCGASARK